MTRNDFNDTLAQPTFERVYDAIASVEGVTRDENNENYLLFEGKRFFIMLAGGEGTNRVLGKLFLRAPALEWLKGKYDDDPIMTSTTDLDVKVVFDGCADIKNMGLFLDRVEEKIKATFNSNVTSVPVEGYGREIGDSFIIGFFRSPFEEDGELDIDVWVSHMPNFQIDDGEMVFPETNSEYVILSTLRNIWLTDTLEDKKEKRLTRALYIMAARGYIDQKKFEDFRSKILSDDTKDEIKKIVEGKLDKKYLSFVMTDNASLETTAVKLQGGSGRAKFAVFLIGIGAVLVNAILAR